MNTAHEQPQPAVSAAEAMKPSTHLLTGKVALITGAVGALGRAIAERFAWHDATVVLADLDERAAESFAADLTARHDSRAIGVGVDITDRAQLETTADRIEQRLNTVVNTVVVNAGVLSNSPALETDDDEWQRTLHVNLTGSFRTATVFARRLRAAAQPGSIIFSSSLFGLRGGSGNAAYSASKFGVIGLAQTMAAELAAEQIRVNAVCPGQIDTPMLTALFTQRAERHQRTPHDERETLRARIPSGRFASTAEIADTYVYLASDLSRYVTGTSLLVDGGWQVG